MSYAVKILADSLSPGGSRLTTFEVNFPRFILAEVNTHRVLSRNSASSRAIPPEKIIERVKENPFLPEFNKRVKGMGIGAALTDKDALLADAIWLSARDAAVNHANMMLILDVDKSRVNRLLEPFAWHTAIISATEWGNFYALRTDENAQSEFRIIATMMQDLHTTSTPVQLQYEQWHLPLVDEAERTERTDHNPGTYAYWKKVAVGRLARVSYLTHDGTRNPGADIELHDRLMTNGHLSPFEHVARPTEGWSAIEPPSNFSGWHQYRKDIPNEQDFSLVKDAV